MLQDLILVGVLQGLLLSLVAYGVMIPFRLSNFPDLTSEGTYPFGGAVCASLIILNINPIMAVIIASILSGLVGLCTAFINLKLKVNSLLAGIIVSTMLYSIDLRIMGKPNIALFDYPVVFDNDNIILKILLMLGIICSLVLPFLAFLYTEKGLRFRAAGLNEDYAKKHSVSITKYTLLSLFIANCFNGVAGALMVQLQNYMDIGMGVGIVIHALAALMIGEIIVGEGKKKLLAPFVGALLYQQIQGFILLIGIAPSDLKLVTGIILLTVLVMKRNKTS